MARGSSRSPTRVPRCAPSGTYQRVLTPRAAHSTIRPARGTTVISGEIADVRRRPVDLKKLSTGDFVIAGATFVYFISLFLTWFSKDFASGIGGGTISRSGLDMGFWALLPFLLYGAILVLIVLDKLVDTVTLPDAPLPWPQI